VNQHGAVAPGDALVANDHVVIGQAPDTVHPDVKG